MINLADIMAGNTMAGEAGQQAPKVLMGANEIASGYLNRESMQNKLMMDDMKLKQAIKDQPIDSLIKRAKAIQELNIDDAPVKEVHMREAWAQAYPDGPPVDEEGNNLAISPEAHDAVGRIAKEIAIKSSGLAKLDLNDPRAFIQTRAEANLLQPDAKVKERIADLNAQAKALKDAAKFERELIKIGQAQGFTMEVLGKKLSASAETQDKSLKASEKRLTKTLAQQQSLRNQQVTEDRRKTQEKMAELTLKEAKAVAGNPFMMAQKKEGLLSSFYDKILMNGTPDQRQLLWDEHESALRKAGRTPPGEAAKPPGKPKNVLSAKEKSFADWAKSVVVKDNVSPSIKAKAAKVLEKLKAEGKL